MHTLSRRGLLVLGGTGAAGAVLAACGEVDDPRGEDRDGELLGAALGAELAVESTARAAAGAGGAAEQTALAKTILEQSSERVAELTGLAEEAGASESEAAETDPAAPLETVIPPAIAAYREASGLLSSTELRATASGYLAVAAAELAALREAAGQDPAPQAFVTGGEEDPHQADDATTSAEPDEASSSEEETTTDEEGG